MSINDLKVIKNESYQKDARELLEEAIAENFETVIILGFKDGNISTKASKWERTIVIVGALEYAKHFVMDHQVDAPT